MLIWTRLPVNVVNIKISEFLIKFNYRTNTPWIYLIIEWQMSFSLVEEADPTTTKTKKNRNDCGMKVVIFLAQKKNKKDEKKTR